MVLRGPRAQGQRDPAPSCSCILEVEAAVDDAGEDYTARKASFLFRWEDEQVKTKVSSLAFEQGSRKHNEKDKDREDEWAWAPERELWLRQERSS